MTSTVVRTYFLPVILVFILSVVIRLPNLDRPLSKHHEFVTAVTLRVLTIWDEAGAASFGYNPVMSYPGATNKSINNHASASGKMVDEAGNFYYVSHPPLGYYMSHFFFKTFGLEPDVLSIQYFHLLLNLLSGFGVYLILLHLLRKAGKSTMIPAIIGLFVYMLSPAVLWFQCNTYMADMAVHFWLVWGIYLFIRLWDRPSPAKGFILGIFTFCMVYTSWLGVFFGATAFILLFVRGIRNSTYFFPAFTVLMGTITSLVLIYYQYSGIAGTEALMEEYSHRFAERGFQLNWGYPLLLAFNYAANYGPLIILAMGFLLVRVIWFRGKKLFHLPKSMMVIMWMPVLLLHLVLANYSGHDFTSLYLSVFIAVVVAFGYCFLSELGFRKCSFVVIAVSVFMGIGLYYYVNLPGQFSRSGALYARDKMLGNEIKNADTEAVVFLMNEKPMPQLIYYAGRNIQQLGTARNPGSKEDVIEWLKDNRRQKGVLINVKEVCGFPAIEKEKITIDLAPKLMRQ